MSTEKIRLEFESRNGDRPWFVHGGSVTDVPEGFEYDDFTTDMCWTCWFGSRESLVIELPRPAVPGGNCIRDHAIRETLESAGLKVNP